MMLDTLFIAKLSKMQFLSTLGLRFFVCLFCFLIPGGF